VITCSGGNVLTTIYATTDCTGATVRNSTTSTGCTSFSGQASQPACNIASLASVLVPTNAIRLDQYYGSGCCPTDSGSFNAFVFVKRDICLSTLFASQQYTCSGGAVGISAFFGNCTNGELVASAGVGADGLCRRVSSPLRYAASCTPSTNFSNDACLANSVSSGARNTAETGSLTRSRVRARRPLLACSAGRPWLSCCCSRLS
jgi:hypothetical protein